MALQIDQGWRNDVSWTGKPTDYSANFTQAYEAAAGRGERKREYDKTFEESKRRFDIENPDLTRSWDTQPGALPPVTAKPSWQQSAPITEAPHTNTEPPSGEAVTTELVQSGPLGVSGFEAQATEPASGAAPTVAALSWDKPAPNWRATNGVDFFNKVAHVNSFEDLHKVIEANPEALQIKKTQAAIQATGQRLTHDAAAKHVTQQMDLAQKKADNDTMESRVELDYKKKMNTRMADLPFDVQNAVKRIPLENGAFSAEAMRLITGSEDARLAKEIADKKLLGFEPIKFDVDKFGRNFAMFSRIAPATVQAIPVLNEKGEKIGDAMPGASGIPRPLPAPRVAPKSTAEDKMRASAEIQKANEARAAAKKEMDAFKTRMFKADGITPAQKGDAGKAAISKYAEMVKNHEALSKEYYRLKGGGGTTNSAPDASDPAGVLNLK